MSNIQQVADQLDAVYRQIDHDQLNEIQQFECDEAWVLLADHEEGVLDRYGKPVTVEQLQASLTYLQTLPKRSTH